jgi:hypothetical protein
MLANWFKLGANAAVLWVSIGMILGRGLAQLVLGRHLLLDRSLWLNGVRNGLGSAVRSPICPIRAEAASEFWCPRQPCSATRSAASIP